MSRNSYYHGFRTRFLEAETKAFLTHPVSLSPPTRVKQSASWVQRRTIYSQNIKRAKGWGRRRTYLTSTFVQRTQMRTEQMEISLNHFRIQRRKMPVSESWPAHLFGGERPLSHFINSLRIIFPHVHSSCIWHHFQLVSLQDTTVA